MIKIHRDLKDIPAKDANDPNLYGYEEHPLKYDFVRTPEKKAISRAIKKAHQSNPTQQVKHFDGRHTHIVDVTPAQAQCYNTVKDLPQNINSIDFSILRKLHRYATVSFLVKKKLLNI